LHDLPLILAVGGKYAFSGNSTMWYGVELGKAAAVQFKFTHKLNNNWTVSTQQNFDGKRLNTKRNPYDIGFDVSYNL